MKYFLSNVYMDRGFFQSRDYLLSEKLQSQGTTNCSLQVYSRSNCHQEAPFASLQHFVKIQECHSRNIFISSKSNPNAVCVFLYGQLNLMIPFMSSTNWIYEIQSFISVTTNATLHGGNPYFNCWKIGLNMIKTPQSSQQ